MVDQSPEVHPTEGLYIARTLIQDRQEVPMRVLNATHHDQKLAKAFPPQAVTTQAGDPTQCGATTGPSPYSEITERDCSNQTKPE
jgi:hypothetical protein